MPKGSAARGEQSDAQLLVGRAADAEDGDPGLRVGRDDAHLVGAPVADRPQRIGVAPQRLGAHGLHGLAVVAGGARGAARSGDSRCSHGGAAPPHQPPHRRLHRLGTTSAPYELVPCCHEGRAAEQRRSRMCSRECALAETHARTSTASPHRLGGREDDANAPPQRALWLPDAPSTSMVRAVVPENDGVDFQPNRRHADTFEHAPYRLCAPTGGARSGRRGMPPGPVRRPRGCRRRRPPAHWIQYSGPTHASPMEPLPPWPEKSARAGARPHTGSTWQQTVQAPHFSTDHNPAIRNNAS